MALGARRFLITFFLLWGFSSTPHSQAQDLSGKLRESMDSAVREHNFSGSVIVTKGGEIIRLGVPPWERLPVAGKG
jgi:hypothetical protein